MLCLVDEIITVSSANVATTALGESGLSAVNIQWSQHTSLGDAGSDRK